MRPLIILLLFAAIQPPAFGANQDTAREILRRMKVRVDVPTLFEKVENGDAKVTRLLLQAGIPPNSELNLGITPLMVAAEKGHEAVVKVLVEEGADLNLKDQVFGKTALMRAVEKGNVGAAKALIQGKADLNAGSERRVNFGIVSSGGKTALMFAADANQVEIVKILIQAGARPDVKNESGEDALAVAEKKGNSQIVELLKQALSRIEKK